MSLLLALTAIAGAWAARSYVQVPGDITGTRIYTLDNGLKVYLSPNHAEPRIQTYVVIHTGSRNDPRETTGLAHYLEHLMFKGTWKFGTSDPQAEAPLLDDIKQRYEQYRKLTDPQQRREAYRGIDSVSQLASKYFIANEYDKLMASIGSDGSNAFTSYDQTCYVEDIPANELENWARVQSDRFQHFVPRGFHTELEAVYEEYNIGLASDGSKQWDALMAKLLPTHPYGFQTTIGTQEHLKNPSIVNIENYFNQYYVANNAAICMAGDFDFDQVMDIVERYFGSWRSNPAVAQPQYAPVPAATAVADTTVWGQESENVMLGWKLAGAASQQADTLALVASMLQNGTAGLVDLNLTMPMSVLGAWAYPIELADYSALAMVGMPLEGQTLDQVRALLLEQVDKLKRGDFSDDLLPSVIANMKLDFYNAIESNSKRADMMMESFVNGREWERQVGRVAALEGVTKQQVADFARRHFADNYALVYKRQGEDTTQHKIDKPAITPIQPNRDMQSDFVREISNSHVTPIQPKWVDFGHDMSCATTCSGLEVLHVANVENGRFDLRLRFPFGITSNKWLPLASQYLSHLGTSQLSPEQVQQAFYKLACNWYIAEEADAVVIGLYGLDQNMPQALALLEQMLDNAKPDDQAWQQLVESEIRNREVSKLEQQNCAQALMAYGKYGPYNPVTNVPTNDELRGADPAQLLELIRDYRNHEHQVLYYGPTPVEQLASTIDELHRVPTKWKPAPAARPYEQWQTTHTEVLIAPYDAKNSIMMQYNNQGRAWSIGHQPLIAIYNDYFGGGMNGIVFQELRESRALAYSASAAYLRPNTPSESEAMQTYIVTQNDKLVDCYTTFNQILGDMPRSQAAFDIAKSSLLKSLASQRTSRMGIINQYLWLKKMDFPLDYSKRIYQALPAATLDQLAQFAAGNVAHKPYRYIILGNPADLNLDALGTLGPIRHLTQGQIFGY